jgi:fructose-1-phosphate kinase PfkB-like protein
MVECGVEDFRYGLAINRIRHYYEEVAGDRADLFLLSGHDDGAGVFANMGLPAEARKPFFAFSTAVLAIDSVVGGAVVALALGAFVDAPLGLAAAAGAVAASLSFIAWIRYAGRLLEASAEGTEPLFPSRAP